MSQTREEREAAARVRMAELAAKFVARTAGEVDSMRATTREASSGRCAGARGIRNLAHRTCGTGATLGFETLADCALSRRTVVPNRRSRPAADDAVDALEALEHGSAQGNR